VLRANIAHALLALLAASGMRQSLGGGPEASSELEAMMIGKTVLFGTAIAAMLGADTSGALGCTRIFWNTNDQGPLIVGRNEDYVSASDPTLVATPRGVERTGTERDQDRSSSIHWTVRYGNVAIYANNRFPNDGVNEAGLTARTLFYLDGDPNESLAPDTRKLELDADHWVSFVLDNFSTVAEAVVAIENRVYLVSVKGRRGYSYATPKHLAIADATGDSAIIEIQRGNARIFHGKEYRILTNPPSYQDQLENAAKYKNATETELPSTWTATDRFVRADFWVRHLPRPRKGDANTAYGFMYSVLGNVALPAGLPVPAEDKAAVRTIMANLPHPDLSYGTATYFQSISDLTNRHYRFKSLVGPSDVFFDLDEYNFGADQSVRIIRRIDLYPMQDWSGDVIPHLQAISGDIYDEPVE
jgi:penicillin V acylase-like amidase (Ntn superfamily)